MRGLKRKQKNVEEGTLPCSSSDFGNAEMVWFHVYLDLGVDEETQLVFPYVILLSRPEDIFVRTRFRQGGA